MNTVLPELTFLERTSTLPTSNSTDDELTSGGKLTEPAEEVQLRRSTRSTWPLSRLQDYITCKISYLIQNYIYYDKVSPKHMAFLGEPDKTIELNNYKEVKDQPILNIVMKDEIKALEKNDTWTLVPLPKGKIFVGCK
jgi:hypothetical protein